MNNDTGKQNKNRKVNKGISSLLGKVRSLVISARNAAARNINTMQVLANFGIGRLIVEYEQTGKKRAAYGQKVLDELSVRLTKEFGRGFSEDNLSNMRKFYMVYREQKQISETVSRKLAIPEDVQAIYSQFTLSWSHYVFLMNISNTDERSFYEIEASEQNWSLRELQRQFDSGLYERLALSRDKKGIKDLSKKGQIVVKPHDLIKNPASEYRLYLPSKEELKQKLMEWSGEEVAKKAAKRLSGKKGRKNG